MDLLEALDAFPFLPDLLAKVYDFLVLRRAELIFDDVAELSTLEEGDYDILSHYAGCSSQ